MAEPKSGIFKSVRFKGKRQHPGDPVRRPVRAFLPAFQHRLLSWTRRLPDDIASRDRFYLLSAWNMPNLAANVSSLWILCIRFARTSNYTIVLCSKSLEISRAANSLVSRRAERLSFLLLRFPVILPSSLQPSVPFSDSHTRLSPLTMFPLLLFSLSSTGILLLLHFFLLLLRLPRSSSSRIRRSSSSQVLFS